MLFRRKLRKFRIFRKKRIDGKAIAYIVAYGYPPREWKR